MWNVIRNVDDGFLAGIDVVMKTLQQRRDEALPDFHDDVGIFVASDYGGRHREAAYEAYSFVFTTPVRWMAWELERRRVREDLHLGRRMSYKNLSDTQRMNALPGFIGAASLLGGVTVTVLVHKRITSLLAPGRGLDMKRVELARFKAWRPSVVERMLRIIYLLTCFVAGFSSEGQRVLWMTDEDEIVANSKHHEDVVDVAATVLSRLAPHSLAKLEVVTTASDNGSLEIEDLTAIADLTAGGVVEVMTALAERGGSTGRSVARVVDPKTRKSVRLLHWISQTSLPLKHIVISVDPGASSSQLNFRRMVFQTMERPRLVQLS